MAKVKMTVSISEEAYREMLDRMRFHNRVFGENKFKSKSEYVEACIRQGLQSVRRDRMRFLGGR